MEGASRLEGLAASSPDTGSGAGWERILSQETEFNKPSAQIAWTEIKRKSAAKVFFIDNLF
jgi:hypothetical protein